MPAVIMYTSSYCPYCTMAKRLLAQKGVTEITEINASASQAVWQEMQTKTGRRTVPQIFIGDFHVGGFDDLSALDRAGKLMPLLGGTSEVLDNIT
jgi:glutaredoxin 3